MEGRRDLPIEARQSRGIAWALLKREEPSAIGAILRQLVFLRERRQRAVREPLFGLSTSGFKAPFPIEPQALALASGGFRFSRARAWICSV